MESSNYIFNLLLAQIYERKIKPGEKLPPLRAFAKELDVDQASLRIALKQLEGMNLLEIRRSDGVYVKDFMETGGLDFLTALCSIKESNKDEPVVDSFLVDEILNFWIAIFPEILFEASQRYSSLDLKRFLEILELQLHHVDDIEKLVELDVLSVEIVGKLTNNIVMTLLLNSLRPMMFKMTDFFYRKLEKESRIRFLKKKREGICRQISGTLDLREAKEKLRTELDRCRQEIQKTVAEEVLHS